MRNFTERRNSKNTLLKISKDPRNNSFKNKNVPGRTCETTYGFLRLTFPNCFNLFNCLLEIKLHLKMQERSRQDSNLRPHDLCETCSFLKLSRNKSAS